MKHICVKKLGHVVRIMDNDDDDDDKLHNE